MAPRVTYRKHNSYNTRSNRIRKVKTPGGRVVVQYPNKTAGSVRCASPCCRVALNGIPRVRSNKFRQLRKRERTVSRPYGGSLCHKCLKERIIRAFLVEEVKIVKKIMIGQ